MDPNIWGQKFWFMMHVTSFEYPLKPNKSDKKHYKNFYEDLKYVLPCEECRHNYSKHIREEPLSSRVLKSRKNLFLWTVKIHNKVNKATGAKNVDPAYVLKQYEKLFKTKIIL
ncbi:MAG: Erv1/Alr family FAD-linked sulfhydryl oxidase [Nitrososphaeraceae archaeon]|nr:Erv1/Alr family FAD-linked sulfhydryl oxidase [Nitrososphaeraceae archaeon]